MHTVEQLGLLKMDFLGLRNLSFIKETLKIIEDNMQKKIELDEIRLDDPKVYKLFS